MISVQRRSGNSLSWNFACYAAAMLCALVSAAALLHLSGGDVAKAFSSLIVGAFGSQKALLGSLAKATPLLLVGLGTVIAFRAKIWNIGQEGQVLAGAMCAYWASLWIGPLPYWIALQFSSLPDWQVVAPWASWQVFSRRGWHQRNHLDGDAELYRDLPASVFA